MPLSLVNNPQLFLWLAMLTMLNQICQDAETNAFIILNLE